MWMGGLAKEDRLVGAYLLEAQNNQPAEGLEDSMLGCRCRQRGVNSTAARRKRQEGPAVEEQ
jgi:hypothetical protein